MRFVEFICAFAEEQDDVINGKTRWSEGKISIDLDAVFAFNVTDQEGVTAVRTHHEVFMIKMEYEEFKKQFCYSVTNVN